MMDYKDIYKHIQGRYGTQAMKAACARARRANAARHVAETINGLPFGMAAETHTDFPRPSAGAAGIDWDLFLASSAGGTVDNLAAFIDSAEQEARKPIEGVNEILRAGMYDADAAFVRSMNERHEQLIKESENFDMNRVIHGLPQENQ